MSIASLRLLAVAAILAVSVTASAHAASAHHVQQSTAVAAVAFDDDPGDIDPDAFINKPH